MRSGLLAVYLLAMTTLPALAVDTILLADDFNDASIDSSKWTIITATGHDTFDESAAGNGVTEESTYLWMKHDTVDAGGAYKSALLPVDDRGEIMIDRNIFIQHNGGTLVSMPDELVAEDGTVLMRWGYHNYNDGSTVRSGFGGFNDTLTTGTWGSFTDEAITYDPISGMGSYSINGSAPVAITGIPFPAGTTNLYLRGSAYGAAGTGYWKAFQSFTVSQSDRKLLAVESPCGAPSPSIGTNAYDTGATILCSAADVAVGGTVYECIGWTGTGSVPAAGTGNSVEITLTEDSSISWIWQANLLEDDFEDGVLDPAKWSLIAANNNTLDEAGSGSSVTESNGLMNISHDVASSGGAYKSALLPVNDQGQIILTRRTKVHTANVLTYMAEELRSGDGTKLMSWGYFNYDYFGFTWLGFGGQYDEKAPAAWDVWFDETITYDPVTGYGSYSINGSDPLSISGTAMPVGTTNVYMIGSASGGYAGNTKQFDAFSAVQGEPADLSVLSIASAYGSPVPAAGSAAYASGSVITCSVESVVSPSDLRYRCTGWTGTGSVPASGSTNVAVITLSENSSITWNWEVIDARLTVSSAHGSPTPAVGTAVYPIGTEITCTVDDVDLGETRHSCVGWSGTGSVPAAGSSNAVTFTINPNSTIAWNWETDHWLQVNVSGGGSISQTNGFYDAGSVLSLSATPDAGWVFEGWRGAATGPGDATVTMNEPKTLMAVFTYPAAITNMTVAQVEGTRTVEVCYDLEADSPVFVDLAVYQNGTNLNVASLSGAHGFVAPGTSNIITWNAGADWNLNIDELTFRLETEDGRPLFEPYEGGSANVPRTGQTADYGLAGTDGALEPGLPWPAPRFTDHSDGTFTDNLTGLMWWSGYRNNATWPSALYYCETLTAGGHSDWRLPNVREQRSLFADYGFAYDRTPGNYPTQHDFWTSTTDPFTSNGYNYKFTVNSGTGISEAAQAWYYTNPQWDPYLQQYVYDSVYYYRYHTAVRGTATGPAAPPVTGQTTGYNSQYATEDGELQNGISWPVPRFTDHGDGTATDHLTGLMWTTASSGPMNWDSARQAANTLTTGGHDDWRLPSVNELESLVDYSIGHDAASLPTGHPFTAISYGYSDTHANAYWSGTTYPDDANRAYGLQFYDGEIGLAFKSYTTTRFLACRGGVEFSAETIEPTARHPLSETGQTNSFAAQDDGAVRAGIAFPNPRFTEQGDGTIRDNQTGLLWWIAGSSETQSWATAVFYADWDDSGTDFRLPNIREMRSLVDLGQSGTVWPEGHPFGDIQSNGVYWTSTSYHPDGNDYAWQVNMQTGLSAVAHKTAAGSYMLVHGPAYQSSVHVPVTGQTNSWYGQDDGAVQAGYTDTGERFVDNGNHTVSDTRTGLMWLQSAEVCGSSPWADAVAYCADFSYGGYNDWRLPNINELESLVDYGRGGGAGPALPEGHPFTDINPTFGAFWSSTTLNSDAGKAFRLSLESGTMAGETKDTVLKIWPVRGGE